MSPPSHSASSRRPPAPSRSSRRPALRGRNPRPPAGAPVYNPAISQFEEAKDSGLGLEWVYLDGDVGGGYASMDSFNSTTLGLQKTSSAGPAFGVAAGIRLIFFSLGVRVRDLQLSGIGDLWELNGEGAFHVRVGHVDGYFGVRGGYNFVGSLNSSTAAVATGDTPSSVSVHGFNVGPMLGLDVYLAKWVSIGVDADVQFLFLQRPKLTIPGPAGSTLSAACEANSQCSNLYNESGSSAGIGFVPTAHLGIHF